jgi:hypothetical protein
LILIVCGNISHLFYKTENKQRNLCYAIQVILAFWNRSSSHKLLGMLIPRPLFSGGEAGVHFLVRAVGTNPRERKRVA